MRHRDFDIARYDANMAADLLAEGTEVVWRNFEEAPFRLGGLPFHVPGGVPRRLPELPQGSIPETVDALAWQTAGATLGFRTDSGSICLRVRLHRSFLMYHMTAVGSAGFDLYMGPPERRVLVAATRFQVDALDYSVVLFDDLPAGEMREYLLEFPLYSGVESLEIGLDPDAVLEAPSPWRSGRKVVFYGTSITQGACASRPGMCLSNLLSRRWNVEVVDLGFSGNGKGEPEVMELVAAVPDPALFVLDYVLNAGLKRFKDTLPGAIDIIRKRHPDVPVALMTPMHVGREMFRAGFAAEFLAYGVVMRAEVEKRRAVGDMNVHFVNGTVESPDWHEFMVECTHLTDLGFYRQYELVAPQLEKLL